MTLTLQCDITATIKVLKMKPQKEIIAEIQTIKDELLQLIALFTPEQINTVPFEGSWTAGQVVDHIMKSVFTISKAIYGTAMQTDRNPDEKVDMVRTLFLDFSKKLNSPDFIIPPKADHQKEELSEAVTIAMLRVIHAVDTFDPSEICLDFELPKAGKFTRYEWFYFIIYHTTRHIHQLKNIFQKLNSSTAPDAIAVSR
jgi:hypothetical protein